MADELETTPSATPSRRLTPGVVGIGGIIAALGIFIAQNTGRTEVTWLIFDREAPIWVVIVVAAVFGAALSELAGWLIRRRNK